MQSTSRCADHFLLASRSCFTHLIAPEYAGPGRYATDMKEVIGNFRILGKIGEGGMGTVFHGRDLMLERDVAIKSLRPELASNDEIVERFRIEAIALARLQHHNIANVFSFFAEDGQYYMVMEYVDGESLGQLTARRGALPWREAAGLIVQALRGLEHAHRAGVIHRDIKPANMMVSRDGTLKLMDFGIARIIEKAGLTRTGYVVGTLQYVSPEQVRCHDLDERSDLYSMAIVLYQLLTGRVPFDHGSEFELMRAHLEQLPEPPSQFIDGLPPELEAIVLRAMHKDPAQRTPNALTFRRELEQLLDVEAGFASDREEATVIRPRPDIMPATVGASEMPSSTVAPSPAPVTVAPAFGPSVAADTTASVQHTPSTTTGVVPGTVEGVGMRPRWTLIAAALLVLAIGAAYLGGRTVGALKSSAVPEAQVPVSAPPAAAAPGIASPQTEDHAASQPAPDLAIAPSVVPSAGGSEPRSGALPASDVALPVVVAPAAPDTAEPAPPPLQRAPAARQTAQATPTTVDKAPLRRSPPPEPSATAEARAAAPARSSNCARIIQQLSLGEDLSEADRSYLRSHCGN